MASVSASATDVSLLLKLRKSPQDQLAWAEFARRYGRRVFSWCRQWGLQEVDAEDVTQNVLMILTEKLREFDYDPSGSFRAWLKTVAQHAWYRYRERQDRAGRASGDSRVMEFLHQLEARDDFAKKLEEEFDCELRDLALLRVAQRVEPKTWSAFEMQVLEQRSSTETAHTLGIPIAMVYVAKSRVLKMLQEEVEWLESSIGQESS
jgi:RNA polymerase sigma factor (sigma-70 family)